MTATATYTYDDTLPHRPSVDELGGDHKLDDEQNPPGANEPEAGAWNNFVRLHAAAARMLPTLSVTLEFPAGVPTVTAIDSMRGTVEPGDVAVTDNGDGDTTMSWAEGLLPTMEREPLCFAHEREHTCAAAVTGTREVTVWTDDSGTPSDCPVTVWVF